MSAYEKLTPTPSSDTKPYWEGLLAGKLVLQRCATCGVARHYPRPVCDRCYSMKVEWFEAAGTGTVHSWTETHYAFLPGYKGDLPYLLLTVDLPEGVRMQAQARGITIDQVKVGMAVRVVADLVKDDLALPVFVRG
jgi:uncharacterized OB-fold protein